MPEGPRQVVRYDDGTGEELEVPLGTTAFVSGKTMFEILPEQWKSVAVRGRVRYAPHPYVWMAPAKAMSTGLGIESDGLELGMGELPEWEEGKVKVLPLVSSSSSLLIPGLELMYAYLAVEEPCHGRLTLPGPPLRRSRTPHRPSSRRCLA